MFLHNFLCTHIQVHVHVGLGSCGSFIFSQTLHLPEFVCYDDGCYLRRFAQKPSRRDLTPTSSQLATVEIIIDKMHMAGHTDAWCHQHCDPKLFRQLDNVPCTNTFVQDLGTCYYISITCLYTFCHRLTLKYVSSICLGCPSMLG